MCKITTEQNTFCKILNQKKKHSSQHFSHFKSINLTTSVAHITIFTKRKLKLKKETLNKETEIKKKMVALNTLSVYGLNEIAYEIAKLNMYFNMKRKLK